MEKIYKKIEFKISKNFFIFNSKCDCKLSKASQRRFKLIYNML